MESLWNETLAEEETILRGFDDDMSLYSLRGDLNDNSTSFVCYESDYYYDLYPQKLMRTLGKKEGELESFRDLLTKAENALKQSEDAVDVSTYYSSLT